MAAVQLQRSGDGVVVLRIDRPEVRNALDTATIAELEDALTALGPAAAGQVFDGFEDPGLIRLGQADRTRKTERLPVQPLRRVARRRHRVRMRLA